MFFTFIKANRNHVHLYRHSEWHLRLQSTGKFAQVYLCVYDDQLLIHLKFEKMSTEQSQREDGYLGSQTTVAEDQLALLAVPSSWGFSFCTGTICCAFFMSFPFWTIWFLSSVSLWLPGVLMTNQHTLFLSFQA